jgi:hypothetical protein
VRISSVQNWGDEARQGNGMQRWSEEESRPKFPSKSGRPEE